MNASSTLCFLALASSTLLSCAASTPHVTPPPANTSAPDAGGASAATTFETMQALVGAWEAATPSGGRLRVTYQLMSAKSVLVETYGAGSGKETLTVFHLDGAHVMATHYCAQANQPRLWSVVEARPRTFSFAFHDATNLADPKASHLVRLTLALTDQDHFERRETYRENGADEETVLSLTRVVVPPADGARVVLR